MVDGLSIVMDPGRMDTELLLSADTSLPRVMRHLEICQAFAGVLNDRTVAVALLEKKPYFHDIVNLAVHPDHRDIGIARELLLYMMDYVRIQGGRYVEAGCGNANVRLFGMLQRLGFRVVGIWPNFFTAKEPIVENGIRNLDMLRFRVDLSEKRAST